jgi:hypothetical protein
MSRLCQPTDEGARVTASDHREAGATAAAAGSANRLGFDLIEIQKFPLSRRANQLARQIMDVAATLAGAFQSLMIVEIADLNILFPSAHQKSSAVGMRV